MAWAARKRPFHQTTDFKNMSTYYTRMPMGARINIGEFLCLSEADPLNTCWLGMQPDGNLVLAGRIGSLGNPGPIKAVWATGTDGTNASYVELQADGNLVVYNEGRHAFWASNTNVPLGVHAELQIAAGHDAVRPYLILLHNGSIVWSAGYFPQNPYSSPVDTRE